MSSGTVQVAHELSTHLGLEIGHESSNTRSEFVRDGTVSWFHVIRFWEPPSNNEHAIRAYKNLCVEFTPLMGFHPAMYRTTGGCSNRVTWDACWKRECFDIVQQEWGCMLPGRKGCETPFQRTLHQTRHPLRTMESLVVKFCDGDQLDTGVVKPEFLSFATALFGQDHNFEEDSCVEAAAHYVLAYNRALLAAQLERFQIEENSACTIAQKAGFLDHSFQPAAEGVVYPPSAERASKICSRDDSDGRHPAQKVMKSTEHKRNEDLIQLNWDDLEGGKHGSKRPAGDASLVEEVKDLTRKLGYDLE